MPKLVCNFCEPPTVIQMTDPVEDESEIPGICPACYKKLAEENDLPMVNIPARLGHCDILRIHEDGDLTVKCGGKKCIVTKEGEVFAEDAEPLPPMPALTPVEEMTI